MRAIPEAGQLALARERILALDAHAERHDILLLNGKRMAWRRFGDGPPLVLIHGGHGSWLHWIRNIDALSARRSVWLPDLPGYGDSDPIDSDGIEEIVDATVQSIDRWAGAGKPVDLCGFSFGGLVASRVAATRGHVRRLAVIGTAGHGLKSRYTLEMRNWRLAREESALWSALRNNLAALMIHDPADIDALALEVHRACCTATRFRSKTVSRASLLAPILEGVEAPVLLVWGEHDVTTQPEAAARSIAGQRAGIEWRIVPGAGHWAQYERADEVNRLLLDWLDGDRPLFP
ncbi:MAG TPA: alpha/beta fold hydrolase [Usitatibacter sp.]|nr:alpha/beta fold hydrolase [Usitatibacter sp.]